MAELFVACFSGGGASLAALLLLVTTDFFVASSAAWLGGARKPATSTSAAAQTANVRQHRDEGESIAIVIKLNIDIVPANLSSKLV
jgi:hypothetical protein